MARKRIRRRKKPVGDYDEVEDLEAEDAEEVEEVEEVEKTCVEVKFLAKEKLKEEKATRHDIKKIITDLGFDLITDMDQGSLNKLYCKLEQM